MGFGRALVWFCLVVGDHTTFNTMKLLLLPLSFVHFFFSFMVFFRLVLGVAFGLGLVNCALLISFFCPCVWRVFRIVFCFILFFFRRRDKT
jgi:hypothetical protein